MNTDICQRSEEKTAQSIKVRFALLYDSWKQETAFLSSAKAIIEHEDFQKIIAMGHDAVPFIVNAIDKEPSPLVWALNLIFNVRISNDPNVTISQACRLWVERLK